MIPPHVLHQAPQGEFPGDYVMVQRWVSEPEAKLWVGTTIVPNAVRSLQRDNRLYVTLPDAPKPGGTGALLVRFAFPERGLSKGGLPGSKIIFCLDNLANIPIYNVAIFGPRKILLG